MKPDRLKYTTESREVLELDQDDLADYSTVHKSFDRFKIWVQRALLKIV